jgi:2-keto-4-pentenoate hydratase
MDARGASEFLLELRAARRVEPDLPPDLRPPDLASAYEVQRLVVDGLSPNAAPIGYKCACTSPVAQAALRIDRPLFGRLLPGTTSADGATLNADTFVHRIVEAEIGFRLAEDVEPIDGGHSAHTIADFVAAVIPAIEIVDYRYGSWTVGAPQVAADNAIHGWWIAGEPLVDWRHLELAEVAVTVERNRSVETTGMGANVLGHPLNVLAWLAEELPQYGERLRAGDLVTTGVTTDVFEADAGDEITAHFDGVGSVRVQFV